MPRPKDKMVPVFDKLSKTTTLMPARELTDTVVYVSRVSEDGTVVQKGFIDPRRTKQPTIKHPPFDEEMRDRLRLIKVAFDEFYPLRLDQWEDRFRRDGFYPLRADQWEAGFRCDTDQLQKLTLWTAAAQAFTAFKIKHYPGEEARRDYHRLMVRSMSVPQEYLCDVVMLTSITREQGEAFINECWPNGTPIKA